MKRIDEKLEDLTDQVESGHSCGQSSRVDSIEKLANKSQEAIENMYKWYARGFAAIILVLLTSGAMFVWYLAGLSYNLEANNKSLEKIETAADTALDAEDLEELVNDAAERAAFKVAIQ